MDRRTFLALTSTAVLLPVSAWAFPQKDLQGVIQWGAGGATDILARGLQPGLESVLKNKVIMTNRPGASGVIGLQYVMQAPADGHTILFGSEAPAIYKVLGLADRDFDDLIPINIYAAVSHIVVVRADSPYKTFSDLLADVSKRPGAVRAGSTGAAGALAVVSAMIRSQQQGWNVAAVPFDSDGFALTGILSGAIEFHVCSMTAAAEMIRGGKVRGLAAVADKPVPPVLDVPPLTSFIPGVSKYLPWGSWFGAWVKSGTPNDVVATLVSAFDAALSNPEYSGLIERFSGRPINLRGADAIAYANRHRSVSSWLLYDAGAAKHSPENFKIPKP